MQGWITNVANNKAPYKRILLPAGLAGGWEPWNIPFPAGDTSIGGYTSMPMELTLPIYKNVGTKLTPI